MADKLSGNIQPSDYKDVVLGLIFLKYISDSFEKRKKSSRGWGRLAMSFENKSEILMYQTEDGSTKISVSIEHFVKIHGDY